MGKGIYLLAISVSGIKNIKNEIRLDFYKKTIGKDFDPEKYRIKAIYGENGSGKSAIITAVKLFKDLLEKQNYLNETGNQNVLREIINKETHKFCFECDFLICGGEKHRVYRYGICLGLSIDGNYEIKSEKLETKNGNYPNQHFQMLFECRDGEIVSLNTNNENVKQFLFEKTKNLLTKTSFIYLALLHVKSLLNDNDFTQFLFGIIFTSALVMFMKVSLDEKDQHELYFLARDLYNQAYLQQAHSEIFSLIYQNVVEFSNVNDQIIKREDFDHYIQEVGRLEKFVKVFKRDLVSIEIDKRDDGEYFRCEMILNYGSYKVNKEFESTGIKKIIKLYECFSMASKNGIVFIDELDSNLNDVYLCKLIEYFMYYGNGQLCFTTHNLDPMQVLKENKNSIDFLSSDNRIVTWTSRGNSSPDNCYRNGLIEDSPFNVDATDFIGILGA